MLQVSVFCLFWGGECWIKGVVGEGGEGWGCWMRGVLVRGVAGEGDGG